MRGERLRLIAESAYQAVTDYQLYALGYQPQPAT